MWLFAVFLAVPLIEIGLFVTVGGWLTLWPTLAIVLGTAVLGLAILRRQGLQMMRDLGGTLRSAQDPLSPMADHGLIMLAGVLLLAPGFFTDTLGLLLLIPPVRRLIIAAFRRRFGGIVVQSGTRTWRATGDQTIIDAEYHEVAPEPPTQARVSRRTQD